MRIASDLYCVGRAAGLAEEKGRALMGGKCDVAEISFGLLAAVRSVVAKKRRDKREAVCSETWTGGRRLLTVVGATLCVRPSVLRCLCKR